MNIEPMEIGYGARAIGVDLNQVGEREADTLRAALLEYGMLVIPGQSLTPQGQVNASEVFGELEDFPPNANQIAGFPQIFRVASRVSDGYTEVGRYWHSDGSFRLVPTPISLWYMVERPGHGGDTLFTDLQFAYRELPGEVKTTIAGMDTSHRNGILHPLVFEHPKTGVAGLYLNVGLTSGIVDLQWREAQSLIAYLDAHLSRDHAVYRHRWSNGDFVVADNFRIAHKATPVSSAERRILNRTTVRGDAAFWKEQLHA